MNDSYLSELRRIRITLVILTIIMALSSGNHSVTVDPIYSESSEYPEKNSNMVTLENGHFGILTSNDELGEEEKIRVYYYDSEKNELILKKESIVSEISQ